MRGKINGAGEWSYNKKNRLIFAIKRLENGGIYILHRTGFSAES